MREVYQTNDDAGVVGDTLEEMVREGARRMLAAALSEEVNGFLGRDPYERSDEFRGYRNGYHRSREVTVGVSAVEVKVPRVSDVPAEVSDDGYSSQIVRKYERTSRQTQELFRKLYLEGLSTGDFEPVFRELVGETTALSANAIVRLKSRWEDEYGRWRSSRLDEKRSLSDDGSPEMLEPSLAEPGGAASEVDAVVFEAQAEGDLPCFHSV